MTTLKPIDAIQYIPPLEACRPQFAAFGFCVMVVMPKTPEKTTGGLFLPDSTKETAEASMEIGRLVRVSPGCWSYMDWPDGTILPDVGDVVYFARYAGSPHVGPDGLLYRIMEDKSIKGLHTPDENALKAVA